jgi:hypothetical protein
VSPSSFRQTVDAVNAAADAVCALLDGGRLLLFDGLQPASADRPIGARSVLLVSLDLARPAFTLAVAGEAFAHPIVPAHALAGGTATWFRAVSATGRAIYDGSVGGEGSDADLVLGSASIPAGSEVAIDRLVYVQLRS